MKIKRESLLRDALYNCHPTSGASLDYRRGVVLGLMSGLLSTGYQFETALAELYRATVETTSNLEPERVEVCMPESWLDDWRKCAKVYGKNGATNTKARDTAKERDASPELMRALNCLLGESDGVK